VSATGLDSTPFSNDDDYNDDDDDDDDDTNNEEISGVAGCVKTLRVRGAFLPSSLWS